MPVFIASAVNRTIPSPGPVAVVVIKSSKAPLFNDDPDVTFMAVPFSSFSTSTSNIVPSFCPVPFNVNKVPLLFNTPVLLSPVSINIPVPDVSPGTVTCMPVPSSMLSSSILIGFMVFGEVDFMWTNLPVVRAVLSVKSSIVPLSKFLACR